jgi:hypothetical protein
MQSRGAAARAKEELNGVLLHQQELKLGWGKAVAMPTTPLFAGTATASVPVKGELLSCLLLHVAARLLQVCGPRKCAQVSRQHGAMHAVCTAVAVGEHISIVGRRGP